jgi:hypothetical protein
MVDSVQGFSGYMGEQLNGSVVITIMNYTT